MSHYTSFIPKPLYVCQLNGSTVQAHGYGLKLIQCPTTHVIIPLWPTYYIPSNPQCTFSPTALKHYLHFDVTTKHLDSLSITTTAGHHLIFPSLQPFTTKQLLDYHRFIIVRLLHSSKPRTLSSPIVNSATSEAPLTCLLAHQRLGHGSDEVLDTGNNHFSVFLSTPIQLVNALASFVSLLRPLIHLKLNQRHTY